MTGLAIDPNCNQGNCRLWLAAAGGGVWRADKALHNNPKWTWVSEGLPSNAIGTLTYDAINSHPFDIRNTFQNIYTYIMPRIISVRKDGAGSLSQARLVVSLTSQLKMGTQCY